MFTAYVEIPFQEEPKVIGLLDPKILGKLLDNSIPGDLPDDWSSGDIFPVFIGYPIDDCAYATGLTTMGKSDRFGRPNLLSRFVVSDEPDFLIDAISVYDLERNASLIEPGELERSLLGFANDDISFRNWEHNLPLGADKSKLVTAVSSTLISPISYISYSRSSDFLRFLRLVYLLSNPFEEGLSFDSFCASGVDTRLSVRLRGIKTDSGSSNFDMGQVRKKKAFFVDLDSGSMINNAKPSETVLAALDEVFQKPLCGLSRRQYLHFIFKLLRDTKRRRKMKTIEDLRGVSANIDSMLESIVRLESILTALSK